MRGLLAGAVAVVLAAIALLIPTVRLPSDIEQRHHALPGILDGELCVVHAGTPARYAKILFGLRKETCSQRSPISDFVS